MEGFQLWLNLPGRDKMQDPWYRDFANNDLPKLVTEQGVAVTVMTGGDSAVGVRVPSARPETSVRVLVSLSVAPPTVTAQVTAWPETGLPD